MHNSISGHEYYIINFKVAKSLDLNHSLYSVHKKIIQDMIKLLANYWAAEDEMAN